MGPALDDASLYSTRTSPEDEPDGMDLRLPFLLSVDMFRCAVVDETQEVSDDLCTRHKILRLISYPRGECGGDLQVEFTSTKINIQLCIVNILSILRRVLPHHNHILASRVSRG